MPDTLLGPEIHATRDGRTVDSPERYAEVHAAYLRRHKPHVSSGPWGSLREVAAYVNHGRWLVDCPHCNNGVAVKPGWPDGRCFNCGAVFTQIVFPAAPIEIDDLLGARPRVENRNWRIPETPDDLRRENREHGIVVEVI